jgi:ATP-binding cassette, subfamily B (MDR/TAP), member 1
LVADELFSKLDCHKVQFPLTVGPLFNCFDLNIYSGGGKSTVIAMLERFYDPKSGSIELDGVNVKEINVSHLRSAIGYVGQEPTLFATTIRANIQYGNPEATFEQIQEAARLANAHDFISAFSDGYDTQVGDKGSQLSGGQKQRIAIARVLVGNPRVLVLDEATSALDSESELVVQEALDNILETQKITTVIVAHRLSTIRGCDIINVLVNGTIVESGTHDELMDKQGYYRDLVVKQDGSGDGMGSKPDSAVDLQNLDDTQPPAGAVPVFEPVKISSLYPHVSFKDVIFSYPTRPKKIVFDGFNLDVERGATVALVGPSGGGKSTTVGLIERFYDPFKGTIEYEGTDIKTLNVQWYRDQIGYVGQEPTLCKYGHTSFVRFGSFFLGAGY